VASDRTRLGWRLLLLVAVVGAGTQGFRANDRAGAETIVWAPEIASIEAFDAEGAPADVADAATLTVTVWPTNQVACGSAPELEPYGFGGFYLWVARNNEPVQKLDLRGELETETIDGVTFPALVYSGIPVDFATDPNVQYRFTVGLDPDVGAVAVVALDPRTWAPDQIQPQGIYHPSPGGLARHAARIQIVWPHDASGSYAPPDRADFVNIGVDLFGQNTELSVSPDFVPGVYPDWPRLLVAEDGAPLARSRTLAQRTTYTVDGITYPRWMFNDIAVDPEHSYEFYVFPADDSRLPSYISNIWTHAASAAPIPISPSLPSPCTN